MKYLYHKDSTVPYAINGRPAPIHYVDANSQDRWCIVEVIKGEHKGKEVCLMVTFKDNSIVDLGDDEGIDVIPNEYLNIDLKAHLETNRLLEEFKLIEAKRQIALAKLTKEDREILGVYE